MENELLFKRQLLADAERKKGKLQLYLKGQLDLNPSTVLTNTPCRFIMNPKGKHLNDLRANIKGQQNAGKSW